MKWILSIVFFVLGSTAMIGQQFECDGEFYLVIYTESKGESVLYQISENGDKFSYKEIQLSEARRLTGLFYNLLDKYLYAIDVNTNELIKMTSEGQVSSQGVIEDLSSDFVISAGHFHPSGEAPFFPAYEKAFEKDTRIYSLNLQRARVGYLGITGAHPVKVLDLATDPFTGTMFGFDNLRGTILQMSVSGTTASLDFENTGISDIDALFFNKEGTLFGYSPSSGMYEIDINDGSLKRLVKVPEGTHADGCSCPYTYSFEKTVAPREVLPCETFEVAYNFTNYTGGGRIVFNFKDSFPEGFEIVDMDTDVLQTFSIVNDDEKNILHLENLIFNVNQESIIKIRVKAASDFLGAFGSHAIQDGFPLAFQEMEQSDDPTTEAFGDATMATVVPSTDIDLENYVRFSCDGETAFISSPIDADQYDWSTGEVTKEIAITETGWYKLDVRGECISLIDSVNISGFPEPLELDLGEDIFLNGGDSTFVSLPSAFLDYEDITWKLESESINCDNCEGVWIKPLEDATLTVELTDSNECIHRDELFINVELKKLVYQPNVFSPDGDGINDRFYLSTPGAATIRDLKIYNRWGNVVYAKSDFPSNVELEGWDGKLRGATEQDQIFSYIAHILFPDNTTEKIVGQVMLISN